MRSVAVTPRSFYMQCNTDGQPVRRSKEKSMFTSFILSKVRAYLKYRETVRELSRLTDRELDDIGVARFQIDGIARTQHAA